MYMKFHQACYDRVCAVKKTTAACSRWIHVVTHVCCHFLQHRAGFFSRLPAHTEFCFSLHFFPVSYTPHCNVASSKMLKKLKLFFHLFFQKLEYIEVRLKHKRPHHPLRKKCLNMPKITKTQSSPTASFSAVLDTPCFTSCRKTDAHTECVSVRLPASQPASRSAEGAVSRAARRAAICDIVLKRGSRQ